MDLVEKLVKLYKNNTECIREFDSSNYGKNLRDELVKIKENPPKNLKLNSLDSYVLKDEIANVFSYLPAHEVENKFGGKVLFWTALKTYYEKKEGVCSGIENVFDGKEKNIESMRYSLWSRFFNSKSEDVFNLWKVYNKIDENFVENYDLISSLRNNLREGCKISDEKLKKYSLKPFKIKEGSAWKEKNWHRILDNDEGYLVKLESPASIGLMKNSEPCAFVSLSPTSSKTLLINAFQGVNKRYFGPEVGIERKVVKTFPQTGLSPFNWKKVLFDVSFEFARQNNFSRIGIQSGHNNLWTKPYRVDGKIHLPLDKAIQIYDKFAESIEMSQGKDKNWYQKVD